MMNAITVQHESGDPDFQQLCDVVVAAMKRLQVPGVVAGILHEGREFMAGFGVTSVENPLPVTADTLFQIGSTTKTFTGTAMTLTVEDDQLMVQMIPKGGFPYQDSPPGPTPPPSRLAFYAPDRVIALDEPLENMRAEFLRGDDGRITWLRTSRLHKRLADH